MTTRLRIGNHEVLARLAEGGMAELFLARPLDAEYARPVVLKRILPRLADDPEHVSMFVDEARLSAALGHPGIPRVLELGQSDGHPYFTMEYLEGKTAFEVQQRVASYGGAAPLPLEHGVHIVIQVAQALHYAHETCGAVHRDVSPANVVVGFDGEVHLIDFGVAYAGQRLAKTRPGFTKGKLAYMSPEQCVARPVDRRSDVFALGIVLYGLTTGTRLFVAETVNQVVRLVTEAQVPPPSSRRADYPPELEAIVLRALSRDPDDRWDSADELASALEDFARRARLQLSSVRLARVMRALFGVPPALPAPMFVPEEGSAAALAPAAAPAPAPAPAGEWRIALPLPAPPLQPLPPRTPEPILLTLPIRRTSRSRRTGLRERVPAPALAAGALGLALGSLLFYLVV